MRDLTEEELKLAPDWATHYYAFDNGAIQFESEEFYARACASTGRIGKTQCNKDYGISGIPIPFDITKHEFSDSKIATSQAFSDSLDLSARYYQWTAVHGYTPEYLIFRVIKSDAIAIAKALGVTGEDLK